MKPTQEQILSALNKLIRENKTELKTEKVELGSVKEIEAQIKSLNKVYGEILKSTLQKFVKDIAELDKEAEQQL